MQDTQSSGKLSAKDAFLANPKEYVHDLRDYSHTHINIPFCEVLCAFCCWVRPFGKDLFAFDELKDSYLVALKKEIELQKLEGDTNRDTKLGVVHFGGGTPSMLSAKELEEILETLYRTYDQDPDDIIYRTVEVRADTLTRDKLREYKEIGINRLSVGFQSFSQNVLDKINRQESVDDYFRFYDDIDAVGFDNVSIDLLYGYSFQTFDELMYDLETAVRLNPDQIEAAPYMTFPGAKFDNKPDTYEKTVLKKMQWSAFTTDYLEDNGYQNYYHKCFAKPGGESFMQLIVAYNIPYHSFGTGAEYYEAYNQKTNGNTRAYIEDPLIFYRERKSYGESGNLIAALCSLEMELLFPEGIEVSYFNNRFDCNLPDFIRRAGDESFVKELMESQKFDDEVTRYTAANHVASTLKKLKIWHDNGLLEVTDDHVRIPLEARFSREMWRFYMSRC